MQIDTVLFPSVKGGDDYARLAAVLQESARVHCPGVDFTLHHAPSVTDEIMAVGRRRQWLFQRNAMKTFMHNQIVQSAKCGEAICLMDCDTMILRDLSLVWWSKFDFAYTVKSPNSGYVCNSGVVFVRVSERTKEFYSAWWQTVLRMLSDEAFHKKWKEKWGGINQAALGWILENHNGTSGGVHVKELKTAEWNACKHDWPTALDKAHVVHILEPLKRCCLQGIATSDPVQNIANVWHRFEKLAKERAA